MELEAAKEQLLDETTDENDFEDTVVVLEMEVIEEDVGIIRGEYLEGGEIEATGSVLMPLGDPNKEGSWWEGMEVDDKRAFGFQLDTRKETWSEKFSAFFSRGIEEGRPQEFIPGVPTQ